MFRKKAMDDWALDYWLLQQYAKLCFRIYYRKIEVVNRQNIPLNQPVILAPNHQNALMDAMVMVCNTPFQIVFLTRADIFKGKLLLRFLTFANMLPIYRIRDGIENVKRNDKVFEKALRVLHNRNFPLGLFAEGNHGDRRRLRPLVKGLFRIAFLAQEKFEDKPGVKIVPIGVDYGHYQHFRTTLFVNVGEPIEVSEFFSAYRDNPVTAINQLKDKFAIALGRQMIDIQTEEYYNLYMRLREVYNDTMRSTLDIHDNTLAARFKADKEMIALLNQELETHPEKIRQLDKLVEEYYVELKEAGLRDWVLKKKKYSLTGLAVSGITMFVLLPVFVLGFVNNYFPYWFAGSRVKNIKDPQFHSSFKYVIGMVVFPVWYLLLAVIVSFNSIPLWSKLLYIALLPVTGLAAFHYYIQFKKLVAKFRFTINRNASKLVKTNNLRERIMEQMHQIINTRKANNENKG